MPPRAAEAPHLGRWISIAVALVIMAGAIWVLARAFRTVTLDGIATALTAEPPWLIALSIALTIVSFSILGAYDAFAAHVVAPGKASAGLAALAGAASNAISATLGFHAVTGTAVRVRVYAKAGLGPADIARVTAISAASLVLGFLSMLAGALMLDGEAAGSVPHWLIGLAIFALLGGLAVWLTGERRSVGFGRFSVTLPSGRVALTLMIMGAAEMTAAVAALHVLLPADVSLSFAAFSVAYIGAVTLGIGSNAPGGIGVFEAAMIEILGGEPRADVLAALLLYRIIYNLLPFVVFTIALVWFELAYRKVSSTADTA